MTARSHGMAHDMVERSQPAFTPAEIVPILAAYPDLDAEPDIVWHSHRPFAASAILRTGRTKVFVKRHDSRVRSVADLSEEHNFIAHLRGRGMAVPAVLRTDGGPTAVTGPVGTYELHALGDGVDRYRDAHSWTPARSLADAEAIGRALARLHRAADGFDAPVRHTRLLVASDALIRATDLEVSVQGWIDTDRHLARALAGRPWQADLHRTILAWHQAAQPHVPAMRPLWVHGDFHASNLLWRGTDVSCVLDFGLANRASAVFDLATAIERNAIGWLDLSHAHTDIGRPGLAEAILRGYEAVRQRPSQEQEGLRHVLPIVHLDFALSEIAYFQAVTGSASDTDAAYTGFLLGHAAWFATAHGLAFLRSLPGAMP